MPEKHYIDNILSLSSFSFVAAAHSIELSMQFAYRRNIVIPQQSVINVLYLYTFECAKSQFLGSLRSPWLRYAPRACYASLRHGATDSDFLIKTLTLT